MDADAIVVGGGIGGAVLALALARRGRTVLVLEREAAPARVTRPEILQEPSVAALDALGVGPGLRTEATLPIHHIEVRRGDDLLFGAGPEDLDAAGAAPRSTDPNLTRRHIADAAAAAPGVEILRGATVTGLLRQDGRIAGVRGTRGEEAFEARGRLVVGDDGVRSVTRTAAGIPIDLRIFPLEFLTLAVPRPPEHPADAMRAWVRPAGLRRAVAAGLFVPLPDDRLAAVLITPRRVWETRYRNAPGAFWDDVARLTPMAAHLREHAAFPGDVTRVLRAWGHAPRYVDDGLALIGDAAHPMSPAGGQGANAAIWDALALADVAGRALEAGDTSAARLREYERRRRPANHRSLVFTRRGAAAARLGRWIAPVAGPALVALLRQVNRSPDRKRALLRQAATAFMER